MAKIDNEIRLLVDQLMSSNEMLSRPWVEKRVAPILKEAYKRGAEMGRVSYDASAPGRPVADEFKPGQPKCKCGAQMIAAGGMCHGCYVVASRKAAGVQTCARCRDGIATDHGYCLDCYRDVTAGLSESAARRYISCTSPTVAEREQQIHGPNAPRCPSCGEYGHVGACNW